MWRARLDGSVIRLTFGQGEEDPAWSPDGREIAYAGYNPRPLGAGAETDIYVISADGRNRRRLTRDPANDWEPSWSPTGKRLLFMSVRPGSGAGDLFVIDRVGRQRRRLTFTGSRCEARPDWSPDGRRILFTTCGTGDVYVMTLKGGGARRILRYTRGAEWSPDGRRLAYAREDGIYIADANGRNERRVASFDATGVTWSTDGLMLAFVGDARDGCGASELRRQMFLLPLAPESAPTPWECVPQYEWDPAFRPR